MSDDDDRDEHDFDMRDPQWERVLGVNSRADGRGGAHTEHGDSVRWGSSEDVAIPSRAPVYTGQIIRVDRASPYPCNWQMIGTLSVPPDWAVSPITDLAWGAYLEILLGVGQTMITHLVNLRALIDLALPPATLFNGASYYFPQIGGSTWVLPWVLPGGLVGKSIQMRAVFACGNVEAPVSVPATLKFSAALSPYNSGDHA